MNYRTKFVAIGGKSGVGKTTLINELISFCPKIFSRPLSYTTRARRVCENDSEYVFVSENEIKLLYAQGRLANLDFNYGNFYAMDKDRLVQDMESTGRIIIKEIHPQYHNKVREIVKNAFISVLIKGIDEDNDIPKQRLEDVKFYEEHEEQEFDLVFMYDKGRSQRDNAKAFFRKLMVYIDMDNVLPPARIIDKKNSIGYSRVANEFTEERRVTTRNFHEISYSFWTSFLKQLRNNDTILELGPGNGWLRSSFEWPPVNYCCVDIASNMKAVIGPSGIVSSVRCMPVRGSSIDCVVASLADPYFYPEMLCEVNRILKDGALFAVTLPAKEWADNLRGVNHNTTTFTLDGGAIASVYSFTFSDKEIEYLAEECGFSVTQLIHLSGAALNGNDVSQAIVQASNNAGKSLYELNIVTAMVWKKKGE